MGVGAGVEVSWGATGASSWVAGATSGARAAGAVSVSLLMVSSSEVQFQSPTKKAP